MTWDNFCLISRGCRGRDRMIVGFTTTCAISTYRHLRCEFESHSWRGVLDTTLCDKVCQWRATGQWFSLNTQVSSTNTTDCHNITEILLKVALNTIDNPNPLSHFCEDAFNFIYLRRNDFYHFHEKLELGYNT